MGLPMGFKNVLWAPWGPSGRQGLHGFFSGCPSKRLRGVVGFARGNESVFSYALDASTIGKPAKDWLLVHQSSGGKEPRHVVLTPKEPRAEITV